MKSHAGAERAFHAADDAADVCPFGERGMRRVDARAFEHQAGDGGEHHHRHREPVAEPILEVVAHLVGRRIVEHGRLAHGTPHTFHQHAEDQQQEEGIHRGFEVEIEVAVVEIEIEAEQIEQVAHVAVDRDDGGADEQSDERDVERVMHPAPGLANHVALAERIAQREDQALDGMVEAIVGDAETHQPVPAKAGVHESDDQQPEQSVHQDDERNGDVPQDLAGDLLVHLRSIGKAGGEGACNRVFNQSIADEFNPLRQVGAGSGCQPAKVRDCGRWISCNGGSLHTICCGFEMADHCG